MRTWMREMVRGTVFRERESELGVAGTIEAFLTPRVSSVTFQMSFVTFLVSMSTGNRLWMFSLN